MKNQIIIYQPEVGLSSLEVRLENETVWLTQNQMAELFEKDRSTITEHIINIYEEGELDENSTRGNFPLVRIEGGRKVSRKVDFFNLDVIQAIPLKEGIFFDGQVFDAYELVNYLLYQ